MCFGGERHPLRFARSSFPFPFPTVPCHEGYGKGNIQEDANNLDQPNTSPYKKRSKIFLFL